MDDENFQRIVEEVRSMSNLNTEEEAKAYFDEKIKKEWSTLKRRQSGKVIDVLEERDPYYKMLKRDMPIESRYSNYFDIEDEEEERIYNDTEKNIGRYPVGFRHYENFENYKIKFPHATIADYTNDSNNLEISFYLTIVNRQVELHEYKAIMRRGYLDMAAQPLYRFQNKLPLDMNYDPD